MGKVNATDREFAQRLAYNEVRGSKAELRNEVRCRFAPPTSAERKAWNRIAAHGGYFGDVIERYGKRTGLGYLASTVIQFGWQDSKGLLIDPARVSCKKNIRRLKGLR